MINPWWNHNLQTDFKTSWAVWKPTQGVRKEDKYRKYPIHNKVLRNIADAPWYVRNEDGDPHSGGRDEKRLYRYKQFDLV